MFNIVNIIPTGVGANIGGFAGDANPVNTVFEEIVDRVITHPNAVNAASLYNATKKTFYVEGFALEKLLKGDWGIKRTKNKIGIVIDKKATKQLTHIINAINACKAVYGIDILAYTITAEEIGAIVTKNQDGFFDGEIKNHQTLLDSVKKLVDKGANAIAVFGFLDNPYEDDDLDYLNGVGADPIGRLEAKISHLVVENTMLPCAHAPVIEEYERTLVDPRVSAEEIGFTYIPCVLKGLQFAPQFFKINSTKDLITYEDINCVVAPYSCLKHDWVNDCIEKNIPIIAVKENTTVLNNTPESLGIEDKVISVNNYLEAIGVIASLKAGLDYKTLIRPLKAVELIN